MPFRAFKPKAFRLKPWTEISVEYRKSRFSEIARFWTHNFQNQGSVIVDVIFDDLSPTHGALPITPLIDIPKGISSKMGLEVA